MKKADIEEWISHPVTVGIVDYYREAKETVDDTVINPIDMSADAFWREGLKKVLMQDLFEDFIDFITDKEQISEALEVGNEE